MVVPNTDPILRLYIQLSYHACTCTCTRRLKFQPGCSSTEAIFSQSRRPRQLYIQFLFPPTNFAFRIIIIIIIIVHPSQKIIQVFFILRLIVVFCFVLFCFVLFCFVLCVFVLQFPPTNFAFRIIIIVIAHPASQNNSRLFLLRLIVVCVVFIVFLGTGA